MKTDLEISKALALAIGWKASDVLLGHAGIMCCVWEGPVHGWQVFDYKDWNVVGPIAGRYNCFPTLKSYGLWDASIGLGTIYGEDTPQKAIAMAVIGAKK